MTNDRENIVIIGGGFSGCNLAIQLTKLNLNNYFNIVLIEKNVDSLTKGLAYSTNTNLHLLNVPVKNLSLYEDKPDDFLEFCRIKWDPKANPEEMKNFYIPRAFYATYIADQFAAIKSQIQIIHQEATNIISTANSQYNIIFKDNSEIKANYVIIACGNLPYSNPRIKNKNYYNSQTYIRNPWKFDYIDRIDKNKPIMIIGTAQTAIDIALVLNDNNIRQPIYMLSRHGYVSQPHNIEATKKMCTNFNCGLTIENLSQNINQAFKQVRTAIKAQPDWRYVIDSLRPITQQYWKSLSLNNKQKFLRHLQSIWDVHRHRLAMSVARDFNDLLQQNKVKILKASLINIEEKDNSAEVTYRPRGLNSSQKLLVSHVINCTGANFKLKSIESLLIQNLYQSNFIQEHELGVGLKTQNIYNIVDANNNTHHNIFIMGGILKPQLFETVAIPELRKQIFEICNLIKESTKSLSKL